MKYFENVFTTLSTIIFIICVLWVSKENTSMFPDFMFDLLESMNNLDMDLLGTLAYVLAPFFLLIGGVYIFNFYSKHNDWPLKVTLATLALLPFGFYGFFGLLFIF